MNTETINGAVIKNELQLLRALQTKLRRELQDWCCVLTLEELAENPRLMQLITSAETLVHPRQTTDRVCLLTECEAAFDRLMHSVSKQERRSNSRLKQKTVKIRCTLALLKRVVKPGRYIRHI